MSFVYQLKELTKTTMMILLWFIINYFKIIWHIVMLVVFLVWIIFLQLHSQLLFGTLNCYLSLPPLYKIQGKTLVLSWNFHWFLKYFPYHHYDDQFLMQLENVLKSFAVNRKLLFQSVFVKNFSDGFTGKVKFKQSNEWELFPFGVFGKLY